MALRTEVLADPEAVAHRAAAWIAETTRQAIGQRDRCVLALSGGTTPLPMLRVLATTPIDWRKVEVIQVDERVAPSASPDRNLAQLRAALLARIPLPASQIHRHAGGRD